jgi:hypothetical protein
VNLYLKEHMVDVNGEQCIAMTRDQLIRYSMFVMGGTGFPHELCEKVAESAMTRLETDPVLEILVFGS